MKKKPAKKSSKAPTRGEQIIVLVDAADNYYELSRATLQRSKVSAKRKREVKKCLYDVLEESGYINAPTMPGSILKEPAAKSQALRYAGFYLRCPRPKK